MSETPLLQLDHLCRRRNGRMVVQDLNLTVHAGQTWGLLGVNGAGKSTTLALLVGALRPHAGQVLLQGQDGAQDPALRQRLLGWLPERVALWPALTVAEHVRIHARLHALAGTAQREACTRVLAKLDLTALGRRQARALSQGQRQRLGLACAWVHQPPLLVLDEPANGLDPIQMQALRRHLARHAADGGASIVSTHLLGEITASCSHVAIVHQGRLRHSGPVDAALERTFMAIATRAEAA